MTGDELFQQTDPTEFAGLTDVNKQLWVSFTSRAAIDPFAANNVSFVTSIFGGGSDTITALAAARQESISRATELGLSVIEAKHVRWARQ